MARRRRSQKQGLFADLFEITAQLPWWAGVVLAVVFYLLLHHYAVAEVAKATAPGAIGGAVVSQVFRMLAMFGQYLLPGVFLLGALASAISRSKNKPSPVGEPSMVPPETRVEPSLHRADSGADLYELWKTPAVGAAASAPRPDQWSLDLLRTIDWKRFEEVCAAYFRQLGFRADTQSHGPDGGIDITLYAAEDPQRISGLVQCKRWNSMVGPKLMRELLGVMTANKVPEGIFITSSTFNDDATRFALKNRIDLIDGTRLLKLIHDRPAADQARLLEVATQGDYLTPTCPNCGIKLVKRENSKDKSIFWACTDYRCKVTMHV